MEPKHQKQTTYQKQPDGSVLITTKSYFESLAHMIEEIEKPQISSFETLKKDVELSLSKVLDDGSPKLVITIERKKGQLRLVQRWVTLKQEFPRR